VISGTTTTLIQEFTRHKISAAIETIDAVIAKSHPFRESQDALRAVRRHVDSLYSRVNNSNYTTEVAKTSCRAVLEQLSEALPLVGFLERATEVTGPVEFHGPFSRMVKQLLGDGAKLILSSTWVFAPYTRTYPADVPKGLENFVYVSFCMSESDNAFLTPLAAHEVGHNIWNILNLNAEYSPIVGQQIVETIRHKYANDWVRIGNGPVAQVDDLVGQVAWGQAAYWVKKQIEETFCDFIGLYLFGVSYIYSFAHFVAPGTAAGEPSYPQAHERFSQLIDAAQEEGWAIDPAFSKALFEVAVRPKTPDAIPNRELLLKIADDARLALVSNVKAKAKKIVADEALLYGHPDISSQLSAFDEGVPCVGADALPDILRAGWEVFIKRFFHCKESERNWGFPISETPKVINELLLKSFEIYEIECRLKDAECSMPQKLLV